MIEDKKRRTWKTWQLVTTAVVALFLGFAAGASDSADDEEARVSAAGQPATTAAEQTPTSPPPTTAPPTAAGPKREFGAGTHRVGVDIAPGTYIAPGGTACYWERQSTFAGTGPDAIIANEFTRGGQAVVTIAATDKGFKTSGCGTWKAA